MTRPGGNTPRTTSSGRRKGIDVRNGSDLCLQCGLCCDGTVFSHFPIEASERELAEGYAFPLDESDTKLSVHQPCPAFRDGCCSVYATGVPAVCSRYRCVLLQAYLAHGRGMAECLEVIDATRAVVSELEQELELEPRSFSAFDFHQFFETHQPADEPEKNARLLQLTTLLTGLCIDYFGWSREHLVAAGEQPRSVPVAAPVSPAAEPSTSKPRSSPG